MLPVSTPLRGSESPSDSTTVVHTLNEKQPAEDVDIATEENIGDYEVIQLPGPDPCAPLDGGTVAWMTIVGSWMVNFCTFGYINAFGVYQDFYTREFLSSTSASNISWIGSFQLFMQYAPGLFVGRAFDAGYFHHLMIFGSLLYVFCMCMLSLVEPGHYIQVFLSQGVGMGIGQGLIFLPSLTVVGHHFRARRALATGFVITGASAGGIIFPIILQRISPEAGFETDPSDSSLSFGNRVRASAAVIGGLLFLANSMMRTRIPPKAGPSPGDDPASPLFWVNVKTILCDSPYVTSIAAAFITNIGLFFPYFYLQLYAIESGVDPSIAFYLLAILNAGSVGGRLLPTFLADRVGVYNMMLPCILSSAVLLISLLAVHDFASMVVVAALYGFTSGAYVSLIPSLIAQQCNRPGEVGTRMGLAFTIVSFAMLVGTPAVGAMLGPKFEWWKAIVFCGACVAFGFMLMLVSRVLFIHRKQASQLV